MPSFRASARTVDMLGRQQIAGIPTAISELFKNSHDAYATHVEVDFFRSRGLFVLRDDGIGMTRSDFEERWLVLGTESKVDGPHMRLPPAPRDIPRRPVLGEKGIGRLAIAAIGSQVLVLTRAKRNGSLDDLVTAFINWTFFEIPGAHLDDIDVPVRVLPGGQLPGPPDIEALVDACLSSFATISERGLTVPDRVADDLARFIDMVDPAALAPRLEGPSLLEDGHGTHFFILPTTETLAADIDAGRRNVDTAPPLTKFLVGFTNTMTPDAPPPVIAARFRDWRHPESPDELIADAEFFTPDEFAAADHHISGSFDEFGQFTGSIRIYGQAPTKHLVAWPDAQGVPVECGPFTLDVAVVQGEREETRLDPEQWANLTQKMARIGGLYIYRDQIRVLPYGNNDYDFLDIERNRTKSATRYYFSYRRMFGVIQLDGTLNAELREKAGREGFRENRAYHQFRDVLKNFFLQTAIDFFREGGSATDLYRQRQEELRQAEAARLKRERTQAQKRRAFQGNIRRLTFAVDTRAAHQEVGDILNNADRDLRRAALINDPDEAAKAYIAAEADSRAALRDVRTRYRIGTPRGVGMSKALRREWEDYRSRIRQLEETLFAPAQTQLDATVEQIADRLGVAVDQRARLRADITIAARQARTAVRPDVARVRKLVEEVGTAVKASVSASLRHLDLTVQQVVAELATVDTSGLDQQELDDLRRSLDGRIEAEVESQRGRFQQLALQLDEARATSQDADSIDVRALDDEELLSLRERSYADLELMQLGTAIQIINHEYVGSIQSMRENLRRLKSWADRNQSLDRVYQDLRSSFDHLDGYLALFTPLQRRLYRSRVDIRGGRIEEFVRELFQERLERHGVDLIATDAFRRLHFLGYPSTFYPVFVNLVDNAIFWVKGRDRRTVQLDALGEGDMTITDTGPGIVERDLDEIFELGFTRKPSGRGTGLYVSRQVLLRDGYTITASNDIKQGLGGACFTIASSGDPTHEEVEDEFAGAESEDFDNTQVDS